MSSEPRWRKRLVNIRGQRSESADWSQTAGRQRRQKVTTGCKQSLQTGHFVRRPALARCDPMKCSSSVVPFHPLPRRDCAWATVSPPSCSFDSFASASSPPILRSAFISLPPPPCQHSPLLSAPPPRHSTGRQRLQTRIGRERGV